jgi:hypothetical protein
MYRRLDWSFLKFSLTKRLHIFSHARQWRVFCAIAYSGKFTLDCFRLDESSTEVESEAEYNQPECETGDRSQTAFRDLQQNNKLQLDCHFTGDSVYASSFTSKRFHLSLTVLI